MSDENKTTDETKLYELGFHIVSLLNESEAESKFVALKKEIEILGGEIVKEKAPKTMSLAYTITKKIKGANTRFNEAYFGWIKFNATAEAILDLKEKVQGDEDILRFLLIKTVDDDERSTSKIPLEEEKEEDEKIEEKKVEKREVKKEEKPVEEPKEEKKEEVAKEIDDAIDELVKEA